MNHGNPCGVRDLSVFTARMGAQEKTAPGGALTPESQGLTDWIGVG